MTALEKYHQETIKRVFKHEAHGRYNEAMRELKTFLKVYNNVRRPKITLT